MVEYSKALIGLILNDLNTDASRSDKFLEALSEPAPDARLLDWEKFERKNRFDYPKGKIALYWLHGQIYAIQEEINENLNSQNTEEDEYDVITTFLCRLSRLIAIPLSKPQIK